jgi:hypothetical protein
MPTFGGDVYSSFTSNFLPRTFFDLLFAHRIAFLPNNSHTTATCRGMTSNLLQLIILFNPPSSSPFPSSSAILHHSFFPRFCVLWAFGGFYADDDSFIGTPLSTIVQENDSMILTPERGAYMECYYPTFKLSKDSLNRTNVNQIQLSSSYDRPIVFWGIFSEPGSRVLENALRNVVEIFKNEYFKRSVIHIKHNQMRAHYVFCSTGQ